MPLTEAISFKGYSILHQVIEAVHGNEVRRIDRFTVHKPNNGPRLSQTDTLGKAKKAVDDDLDSATTGGQ